MPDALESVTRRAKECEENPAEMSSPSCSRGAENNKKHLFEQASAKTEPESRLSFDEVSEEANATTAATDLRKHRDEEALSNVTQQNPAEEDPLRTCFFRRVLRGVFLVVVGALACSFWRGLWTLFDIYSCGQTKESTLFNGELFCLSYGLESSQRRESAVISAGLGLGLTCMGKLLFWMGLFDDQSTTISLLLATRRILMVHIMGIGGVFTWRGIWMLSEQWLWPNDLLKSAWWSFILGTAGCLLLCCSASLVAAPTGLLEDPSSVTFDTIFGSRMRQKMPLTTMPELPLWKTHLDLLVSYILLPIMEVWSWRGIWTLEDYYLWGYSVSDSDLQGSFWMGSAIFVVCAGVSHFIGFHKSVSPLVLHATSRVQNLLLGVASVSFWRIVWYSWDHWAGSSALSAWTSHLLAMAGLVAMGGFANATFPPAVDMVSFHADHPPKAEGDILLIGLHWFGIARSLDSIAS